MLNLKEINEKLWNIGILPITEYNGLDKKYNLIDKDGYKYYVRLQGIINQNKFPWKFHKSNPYSIYNIKNFIKINNIGGGYMSRFVTASKANRQGFKSGTVNRVLKGKQKYAYDSLWVYEDDYLSGNYIIP